MSEAEDVAEELWEGRCEAGFGARRVVEGGTTS